MNRLLLVAAIGGSGVFTVPEPEEPDPVTPYPGLPVMEDLDWASYEFIAAPDQQEFHDATVDGDALRVDSDGWSIDTPEDPDSVLAFLTYTDWNDYAAEIDVSALDHIRIRMGGDGLNLYGAHAEFWLVTNGTRWHLEEEMALDDTMRTFDLGLAGPWYRSWTVTNKTLQETKDHVESYGIALVGFSQKPIGALLVEEMTWWMNP